MEKHTNYPYSINTSETHIAGSYEQYPPWLSGAVDPNMTHLLRQPPNTPTRAQPSPAATDGRRMLTSSYTLLLFHIHKCDHFIFLGDHNPTRSMTANT